jgi:hypothetical protein
MHGKDQHTFVPLAQRQTNGVESAADQAKALKCFTQIPVLSGINRNEDALL